MIIFNLLFIFLVGIFCFIIARQYYNDGDYLWACLFSGLVGWNICGFIIRIFEALL